MIDLTPLLQAVIMLASVVITVYVIPYVKSKTTEAQRQEINEWVKIAVLAAEQIYKGSGMGKSKKLYVNEFLAQKGFKVSEKELDNMIESVVLELNKGIL